MDVQLPNGAVLRGVPDGTTKQQIAEKLKANGVDVPKDWLEPNPLSLEAGAEHLKAFGQVAAQHPFTTLPGVLENAVSGVTGGVGSLADAVTGAQPGTHDFAYRPRTAAGKEIARIGSEEATGISQLYDKTAGTGPLAQTLKERIPEAMGAIGTVTGAMEGVGALRGLRTRGTASTPARGTMNAPPPEAAARAFVRSRTSLDWDSLSARTKEALTQIAQDSKRLDKLDPQAVERQARLEKLGLPATRGQVTRDLAQLTREENITKSDAGVPIRDINAEQDRVLHEHLDTLRGQTGGKAQTRSQLGESVQGAARGKLDALRRDYQEAYQAAKESGSLQEPADISNLKAWLKNPTNRRNAGYLSKAISDYEKRGEKGRFIPKDHVSINNLEEIRKEATANTKKPGPEGHFAKEAVKVIDEILDKSGGDLYKEARGKFKSVKDEFDRQGRVSGLVKQKGMTRDRAVALEDTFDNIVRRGSNEQLVAVRDTLTKGGTPETQAKGTQAWKDLQASTIDYLKDAAAGKRAIPGEKNQLQFNSTFLDALFDLDKDGKLDTLFGPGTSARIREIAQATRDIRTKPTGRIAGSDTTPRIISLLEKLSKIPVAGKYVEGTARVVGKIGSLGEEARQVRRAQTSPLEEEARAASKASKSSARRRNTLSGLKTAAPVGALTLRDEDQ